MAAAESGGPHCAPCSSKALPAAASCVHTQAPHQNIDVLIHTRTSTNTHPYTHGLAPASGPAQRSAASLCGCSRRCAISYCDWQRG